MTSSERLESFWEKYDMLPPGSRVLCAVSGGADSVCMLHLLSRRNDISVFCAHYNHQLRGGESDRDEAFVRSLCGDLGIECVCGRGDVSARAKEMRLGTEEAARKLRYEFLEMSAGKLGADRIATAHNADDNAETVLLNLARGTGLSGLCGIPPVRGKIIRPLLLWSREDIMAYLDKNGLEHVEDSTNGSDDYSRNRLRHHVLPVLREINSGASANISRACGLLREDEAYLSGCAQSFIDEELRDGCIPVSRLMKLPESVIMRVFRKLCGPSLGENHARALLDICRGGRTHAAADIPGRRAVKDRDRLIFTAVPPGSIAERELRPGQTLEIPEAAVKIICEHGIFHGEINKTFNTFLFKSESICGRISVASRHDGDKVELQGRKCVKSLKKLFLEAGIPLDRRGLIPVLYDEKGVIAVCGFGAAQRCRPQEGDSIIKAEVIQLDGREKNGK